MNEIKDELEKLSGMLFWGVMAIVSLQGYVINCANYFGILFVIAFVMFAFVKFDIYPQILRKIFREKEGEKQ